MGITFGALAIIVVKVGTKIGVGDGGKQLGGNDGKFVPIDICKKGGRFGEQGITYPLLLI